MMIPEIHSNKICRKDVPKIETRYRQGLERNINHIGTVVIYQAPK